MGARYYRHSGAIPMGGIVKGLGAGLLVAALLSFPYGFLTNWIPFIYLNVLMALGYGGAVGWAVGRGAVSGKVRNLLAVVGMALLAGMVAEYGGWVAWIYAITDREVLILDPSGLLIVMARLAEKGVWSMSGSTPTGALLYCFWAGEALLVLGTACAVAKGMMENKPFCERCQVWLSDGRLFPPLVAIGNPDELRRRMESNDYAGFQDLRPIQGDEDASKHSILTLNQCDTCEKVHLLSLSSVTLTVNKKGETERKEKFVARNLLVEPEVHRHVEQIFVPPTPGE